MESKTQMPAQFRHLRQVGEADLCKGQSSSRMAADGNGHTPSASEGQQKMKQL